jgi:hypothetical protein
MVSIKNTASSICLGALVIVSFTFILCHSSKDHKGMCLSWFKPLFILVFTCVFAVWNQCFTLKWCFVQFVNYVLSLFYGIGILEWTEFCGYSGTIPCHLDECMNFCEQTGYERGRSARPAWFCRINLLLPKKLKHCQSQLCKILQCALKQSDLRRTKCMYCTAWSKPSIKIWSLRNPNDKVVPANWTWCFAS